MIFILPSATIQFIRASPPPLPGFLKRPRFPRRTLTRRRNTSGVGCGVGDGGGDGGGKCVGGDRHRTDSVSEFARVTGPDADGCNRVGLFFPTNARDESSPWQIPCQMFITEYVRRSSVNRILGYLFFRPPPPPPHNRNSRYRRDLPLCDFYPSPCLRTDGKKRLPVPVGTRARTAGVVYVGGDGNENESQSSIRQSLAVETEDLASCYELGRTTYDDVGDLWVRSSKIKKKK